MNAKRLGDVFFDEFTSLTKKMQNAYGGSLGKASHKAYSALFDMTQSDKGIEKLISKGFDEDLIQKAGEYINTNHINVLKNGEKMFGDSPKYSAMLESQQVWNTLMNNTRDTLNKWK